MIRLLESQIARVDSPARCTPDAGVELVTDVDRRDAPFSKLSQLKSLGRPANGFNWRFGVASRTRQQISPGSKHPEQTDEFVRDLVRRRQLGLPFDDYLPVDCSQCGKSFYVHEDEYREWRAKAALLLCPGCLSEFQFAWWGTVPCENCGVHSLLMPLFSVCTELDYDHKYKCPACWEGPASL
jgi:hypothetical protein